MTYDIHAPRFLNRATVLFFATALLPVYLSASGGIQPTHALFAFFSLIVVVNNGLPKENWSYLLFSLCVYSFFVESFYIIGGSDARHLMNSVFLFFNYFISCAIYYFCKTKGTRPIFLGLIFASAIAMFSIYQTGFDLREMSDSGRSTGTFNNPNQLGYYSVCLLSLTYILSRNIRRSVVLIVAMTGISLLLALLSLSKAAMIANFIVSPYVVRSSLSKKFLVLWWVSLFLAIYIIAYLISNGGLDSFLFARRLENMAFESDSSLSARGYFAFSDASFLSFVFGLGTGEVFDIIGHEVHSSLGSILNSYGLIGFLIFIFILGIWIRNVWFTFGNIGIICIIGPPMLYGITHNGTRFTAFWVLFSVSLALSERTKPPLLLKPAQG